MLKFFITLFLPALALSPVLAGGLIPEHPTTLPPVKILFLGSEGDPAIRHFLHPDGKEKPLTVIGISHHEELAASLGFRVDNHAIALPPRGSVSKPRVILIGPQDATQSPEDLRSLARAATGYGADLIVHPAAAPWVAEAFYPTARIFTGSAAAGAMAASGQLTICIPPRGAVHFRGSEISNAALPPVRILLASNAHRKDRTVTLRKNASHEYLLLARAARERAAPNPFPPLHPPPPALKNGALVLGGGGKTPSSVLKWMLHRSGGPGRARLVIIPTARADRDLKIDKDIATFREIGFETISVAHVRRDEGKESSVSRAIDRANAVWFTGGRQWRLVDAYENGPACDALHRLLARGGVIGGASAGATICGHYLVRGDPRSSNIMTAEGYERGFQFLPGVAVDQHFAERKRFKDLETLIHQYPQFLGIGIDESTAIIVEGSSFIVRGLGKVAIYDRNPDNVPAGHPVYRRLKAYQRYDLVHRKPL